MLIRLPLHAESALSEIAIRERRDLRRQAEYLLLEVLEQRGYSVREASLPGGAAVDAGVSARSRSFPDAENDEIEVAK